MRISWRCNLQQLIGLYLTSLSLLCFIQHPIRCDALLPLKNGPIQRMKTLVPLPPAQQSTPHVAPNSKHSTKFNKQQQLRIKLPPLSSSLSPSQESNSRRRRSANLSIIAILLSTSLNLLGFTMTSPLTPTLGQHFNLELGASFGSLNSAYPLGMLFGLFLWPRLSDSKMGRKPVMALTLLGSAVGLGFQSLAVVQGWTLERFLLMRAFTGCFAGSSPVAKAFLADLVGRVQAATAVTNAEEGGDASERQTDLLSKYLAWRDASSTLAYIIGPAIGGIVYAASLRGLPRIIGGGGLESSSGSVISTALAFVIGLSALASLVAATLVGVLVTDNEEETGDVGTSMKTKMDKTEVKEDKNYKIISCPLGRDLYTGVATVCVVSFLYHVADSTFFAFFPALLQQRLSLDARAIGLAFTGFASISFAVSASSLSSICIKKLGVVNTCALGLSTIGLGLGALSTVAGTATIGSLGVLPLAAAALYFCGVPLYGPTIPTMLLQCVPPSRRGAVMGLDGAVNTVARVISPIVMGDLYRRKGASAAFGLASVSVFGSAVIALVRRMMVLRGNRMEELVSS